jgi:CRISPR/Cas system CSM-associated protein Csm4 (group 5 of RAMP superfamily)
MQKASIKLILRAFNGECDGFTEKVNCKNVQLMMNRIEASYEAICKIVEKSNMVTMNEIYKDLKKKEFGYVYEYEEWKQREKEEQARIREQIREEERANKEFEKTKREAEKKPSEMQLPLRRQDQKWKVQMNNRNQGCSTKSRN